MSLTIDQVLQEVIGKATAAFAEDDGDAIENIIRRQNEAIRKLIKQKGAIASKLNWANYLEVSKADDAEIASILNGGVGG